MEILFHDGDARIGISSSFLKCCFADILITTFRSCKGVSYGITALYTNIGPFKSYTKSLIVRTSDLGVDWKYTFPFYCFSSLPTNDITAANSWIYQRLFIAGSGSFIFNHFLNGNQTTCFMLLIIKIIRISANFIAHFFIIFILSWTCVFLLFLVWRRFECEVLCSNYS